MAYLSFDVFTAAVPLASAASQTYNFKRPVGSLSALSGYDIDFSAGTGVFRVSALVEGTLVSAVQVSAASDTIHLESTEAGAASALSAYDLDAGEDLQIIVQHLSGGAASDFVLVLDSNADVTLGELEFVSASVDYGVEDPGSTPVLSATKVDPVAGQSTVITTLSTIVNATTTLSSDNVVKSLIAPNVYLFQGDTFAFTTAVSATSALIGLTNDITISFDVAPYTGSRAINEHLRGRHLGYF